MHMMRNNAKSMLSNYGAENVNIGSAKPISRADKLNYPLPDQRNLETLHSAERALNNRSGPNSPIAINSQTQESKNMNDVNQFIKEDRDYYLKSMGPSNLGSGTISPKQGLARNGAITQSYEQLPSADNL